MEIGAVALPTEDEWYKAAYFSGQPAPGNWTDQALVVGQLATEISMGSLSQKKQKMLKQQ